MYESGNEDIEINEDKTIETIGFISGTSISSSKSCSHTPFLHLYPFGIVKSSLANYSYLYFFYFFFNFLSMFKFV